MPISYHGLGLDLSIYLLWRSFSPSGMPSELHHFGDDKIKASGSGYEKYRFKKATEDWLSSSETRMNNSRKRGRKSRACNFEGLEHGERAHSCFNR
jgi:hypothetical protein